MSGKWPFLFVSLILPAEVLTLPPYAAVEYLRHYAILSLINSTIQFLLLKVQRVH